MSESQITVTIRLIDNFSAAAARAQQAILRWMWLVWWQMWGTDGWKRRTALVALPQPDPEIPHG